MEEDMKCMKHRVQNVVWNMLNSNITVKCLCRVQEKLMMLDKIDFEVIKPIKLLNLAPSCLTKTCICRIGFDFLSQFSCKLLTKTYICHKLNSKQIATTACLKFFSTAAWRWMKKDAKERK